MSFLFLKDGRFHISWYLRRYGSVCKARLEFVIMFRKTQIDQTLEHNIFQMTNRSIIEVARRQMRVEVLIKIERFDRGKTNRFCPFCNELNQAQARTLCCKAKIRLYSNQDSPTQQMSLSIGRTHVSKLIKKDIRLINNSISLSLEEINEIIESDGGWNPNLVKQGRIYNKIAELMPDGKEILTFCQLYVMDNSNTELELSLRFGFGISQNVKRSKSRYVNDFKMILEIYKKDVTTISVRISVDARSFNEHEGRHNEQTGTHWKNKMGFFHRVFNSQAKSPKFVQAS